MRIAQPAWRANLVLLSQRVGRPVETYAGFIQALEERRAFFCEMGAVSTDHAVVEPYTEPLAPATLEALFLRALRGEATAEDQYRFEGHMLMEMARMSIEDGMVMQIHPGSLRNHNEAVYRRFGPDKGADIPVSTEFTQNLKPLLNQYGTDPRL